MAKVYLALMICTALPVVALQAGMAEELLVWLALGLILVKSILLIDQFMEMHRAPGAWRLAAQAWAPVVITVIAVLHGAG